ncbi:MAG: tRNA 2-thiouridine(34) synthase MnmA [Candidatus Colwellbacteria bacterium]|nr:tRNA 2-thiouridine(34) synthase MnmA [Candidatus Colwellbacteria bacterium]
MRNEYNKKAESPERSRRVFVAMSGGVDSSVAALLLRNQGYEVTGIHLRCWNRDGCDVKEADDARRVANHLGIPFYVLDLEKEYKAKVVDYMIEGYRRGLTPNPDVMCNKEIKFGLFLEKALAMGADYISTGHYARLEKDLKTENWKLKIARDEQKDQSYFLWTLTQEQLKYCLFPIGDYLKSEVRKMARDAGLPTAEKKDSQGICFVGKVTLEEFLSEYLPQKQGRVFDSDGKVVGAHSGAHFYTIGQRHGLGVALNEPHYVAEKDVEKNTVVLARESDESLYRNEIELTDVNFINPIEGGDIFVRVRYRQPLVPAKLYSVPGTRYRVFFEHPQKFVAPGQSAVFYLPCRSGAKAGYGYEMLGGGVIIG